MIVAYVNGPALVGMIVLPLLLVFLGTGRAR